MLLVCLNERRGLVEGPRPSYWQERCDRGHRKPQIVDGAWLLCKYRTGDLGWRSRYRRWWQRESCFRCRWHCERSMEFGMLLLGIFTVITYLMCYATSRNVLHAWKPSQRPMAPLSNVRKANARRHSTLIVLVTAMQWASCSQLCGRLRKKSFFSTLRHRARRAIIVLTRWRLMLVTPPMA